MITASHARQHQKATERLHISCQPATGTGSCTACGAQNYSPGIGPAKAPDLEHLFKVVIQQTAYQSSSLIFCSLCLRDLGIAIQPYRAGLDEGQYQDKGIRAGSSVALRLEAGVHLGTVLEVHEELALIRWDGVVGAGATSLVNIDDPALSTWPAAGQ
jgi:hypothetical protein